MCVCVFFSTAPPVYQTQTAPPQTAAYSMYPQPVFMTQPQYPMPVPVSISIIVSVE